MIDDDNAVLTLLADLIKRNHESPGDLLAIRDRLKQGMKT